MKKGIKWEFLPKTFQDAIYVARRLSIRYLWIDSLCIIQDSAEDWLSQANEMADIYGKSILIISATRAPNCHAGFLQNPSLPNTVEMSFAIGNGEKQTISMREALDHHQWCLGSPFDGEDQDLRTRAWCYQEHLLSPRSLQFGKVEMSFDCKETFECECRCPNAIATEKSLRYKREFHSQVKAARSDKALLMKLWVSILTAYTRQRITKDTDRLPALAGIINLISSQTGLVRHAGHWSNMFVESLAWRVMYGGARRVSEERVPTWSWASLEYDNRVTPMWSSVQFQIDKAEVIHVDCPALAPQEGQDTRTAALKLKALTMEAELVYDTESSNEAAKLSLRSPSMAISGDDGVANCLLFDVTDETKVNHQRIKYVPLGVRQTYDKYNPLDIGLLICRPHATSIGYYQKIGFVRPLEKHWKAQYRSVMTTATTAIV